MRICIKKTYIERNMVYEYNDKKKIKHNYCKNRSTLVNLCQHI